MEINLKGLAENIDVVVHVYFSVKYINLPGVGANSYFTLIV